MCVCDGERHRCGVAACVCVLESRDAEGVEVGRTVQWEGPGMVTTATWTELSSHHRWGGAYL